MQRQPQKWSWSVVVSVALQILFYNEFISTCTMAIHVVYKIVIWWWQVKILFFKLLHTKYSGNANLLHWTDVVGDHVFLQKLLVSEEDMLEKSFSANNKRSTFTLRLSFDLLLPCIVDSMHTCTIALVASLLVCRVFKWKKAIKFCEEIVYTKYFVIQLCTKCTTMRKVW